MDSSTAVSKMYAPGMLRPKKRRGGVLQIWVTRACNRSCFGCTQGSNLTGKPGFITLEQFERACNSLNDYFGTVGIFGGNPATHPQFPDLCEILRDIIPYEQRGLWCNDPLGHGKEMQRTFNPLVSNLNVHLDEKSYAEFKRDWPESMPFGLKEDSRHSPPYVALKDVVEDIGERWDLISNCDINHHWSAMICVFQDNLRGYFCEIAGCQAMLHQHEEEYPDLGLPIGKDWWKRPIENFLPQISFHCHRCGVPLRGYGELACAKNGTEQTSQEHWRVYTPKRKGRNVQIVNDIEQLRSQNLSFIDYIGGAKL